MRSMCLWVLVPALSGCGAVKPSADGSFAEIATAVGDGCEAPSAVVRELRDAQARHIKTRSMPVRVPPGVYSVGVSCGSIFDSTAGACIDSSAAEGAVNVPPYELLLQAGKRYVFSCRMQKERYVLRLSEEDAAVPYKRP
jgi:hypothetical protein